MPQTFNFDLLNPSTNQMETFRIRATTRESATDQLKQARPEVTEFSLTRIDDQDLLHYEVSLRKCHFETLAPWPTVLADACDAFGLDELQELLEKAHPGHTELQVNRVDGRLLAPCLAVCDTCGKLAELSQAYVCQNCIKAYEDQEAIRLAKLKAENPVSTHCDTCGRLKPTNHPWNECHTCQHWLIEGLVDDIAEVLEVDTGIMGPRQFTHACQVAAKDIERLLPEEGKTPHTFSDLSGTLKAKDELLDEMVLAIDCHAPLEQLRRLMSLKSRHLATKA